MANRSKWLRFRARFHRGCFENETTLVGKRAYLVSSVRPTFHGTVSVTSSVGRSMPYSGSCTFVAVLAVAGLSLKLSSFAHCFSPAQAAKKSVPFVRRPLYRGFSGLSCVSRLEQRVPVTLYVPARTLHKCWPHRCSLTNLPAECNVVRSLDSGWSSGCQTARTIR